MSATNAYLSPVDFKLPNNPPSFSGSKELQDLFNQNWQTLQLIIQAFTNNCGIAARLPSQWSGLAGSVGTVLAQNVGRYYDTATEAIAFGAAVNLGIGGLRNANATNNAKPADGFCSTVGGIASGAVGEVILGRGVATGLAGLVKGTRYFLDTVNGGYTAVAPVAAGNIEQYIGFALNANTLLFTSHYWVQH